MIIIFQLLFAIFSLYAIYNIIKRRREGHLGQKGMFFWILFWFFADVAVFWPNSTTIIANYFGIGRGTDFVIYISLSILFYLIFKMNVKIESVGRDITKIVRQNAIDQVKDKD